MRAEHRLSGIRVLAT